MDLFKKIEVLKHGNKDLLWKVERYLDHQLSEIDEEIVERLIAEEPLAQEYFHLKTSEFQKIEASIPKLNLQASKAYSEELKIEVLKTLKLKKKVPFLFFYWKLAKKFLSSREE